MEASEDDPAATAPKAPISIVLARWIGLLESAIIFWIAFGPIQWFVAVPLMLFGVVGFITSLSLWQPRTIARKVALGLSIFIPVVPRI